MIRGGWYINLDRSAERRARMEATVARVPAPVERFPALTAESIPPAIAARFAPGSRLLPVEQACFASHLALLERAAGAAPGHHLILEDDVEIGDGLADIAADLAAWPGAAEVIRLENPLKHPGLLVRQGARRAYVRPLRAPVSSAGYLVTPAGARRLLDFAWEVDIPYDRFLRAIGRADADILVCAPSPLVHRAGPSTIGARPSRRQRGRVGYRGSAFSPSRELRFARRFGWRNLSRLIVAAVRMRAAGVRLDRAGDYILRPSEGAR